MFLRKSLHCRLMKSRFNHYSTNFTNFGVQNLMKSPQNLGIMSSPLKFNFSKNSSNQKSTRASSQSKTKSTNPKTNTIFKYQKKKNNEKLTPSQQKAKLNTLYEKGVVGWLRTLKDDIPLLAGIPFMMMILHNSYLTLDMIDTMYHDTFFKYKMNNIRFNILLQNIFFVILPTPLIHDKTYSSQEYLSIINSILYQRIHRSNFILDRNNHISGREYGKIQTREGRNKILRKS